MHLADEKHHFGRGRNAVKKFDVAVVAAMARSRLFPNTNRSPSAMSCRSLRCPDSGTAGTGSGARMAATAPAETRKLTESTRTAAELPTAWTRPPATLGPATAATCALPVSFAFPSTKFSPPDERRQVRLVGDIEEHREDAAHQCDDEKLCEGQPTGAVGDRH